MFPELIRLQASASTATQARRLAISAYSGGMMQVDRFGPVVVDLAGLEVPPDFPILTDHTNAINAVVGAGTASNNGRALTVSATLADSDAAGEVERLLRSGVNLQASIGAEPIKTRRIPAGEVVNVNGREVSANHDWILVTKSRLREVSVTPIGADAFTAVTIAASLKGTAMKTFEEWVKSLGLEPDTLTPEQRAELERAHASISTSDTPSPAPGDEPMTTAAAVVEVLANAGATTLVGRSVRERWTMERARSEALNHIRASRPAPTPTQVTGPTERQALEAGLLIRCGYPDAAVRYLGEQAAHAGDRFRSTSLVELCGHALRSSGQDVPHDRREMIRAAVSTSSIPNLLSDVANKILMEQWRTGRPTWRSFAAIKPANDFKPHKGIRPSFNKALEPVGPAGEVKHGTIGEEGYDFQVYQFAQLISIDRVHIVNDDLGALTEVIPGMGRAAARTLSDLVYAVLLANGGSFFATGNSNLLNTASDLSASSLERAVRLMRLQRNPAGDVLDMQPKTIAVPPSLEFVARQILESTERQRDYQLDQAPSGNPTKGIANLEVEARLESGCRNPLTGAAVAGSAIGWYLFADPTDAPMIVSFLDGRESPTVTTFGYDSDPDRLAMSFRILHDFGAAFADHRAAVFADGTPAEGG